MLISMIPSPATPAAPSASPAGEALVLGLAYGVLHVVGPDHLGTVIALSVTANSPAHAFAVGASWSLGHCAGMCVVAVLVLCLERLIEVDMEVWEHFGDYVIGFSMLACGLYFIVREHDFLDVKSDGSVSLKGCSCHGHSHPCVPDGHSLVPGHCRPVTKRSSKRLARAGKPSFAASYGRCQHAGCEANDCREEAYEMDNDDQDAEEVPLLPCAAPCADVVPIELDTSKLKSDHRTGDVQSALIGVLQGMCCPMGLVGIAFLTSLPPVGIVIFVVVFLIVSALGTGGVASLWLQFASHSFTNGAVSQKTLYRMSCGFTVLLGAAWIIANFYGVLDQLNYAEGGHGHEHAVVAVAFRQEGNITRDPGGNAPY